MKKIELKEMQQIELNLLLELGKVCKKHSLRYYIDGGTLLGAMCYEGFIPWDDDIDLKMPRPDYEKLMKLQPEFPYYIRLDAPASEHCEYTMLKLIDDRTILKEQNGENIKTTGVYLDIFPMDGYPDDTTECERHIAKLQRLNTLFHISLDNFNAMKESKRLITKIKGIIYKNIYSPWKIYQKLTELAKEYDYDSARYVGLLIEGDAIKEKFDKKWLEPGFTMEFEGYQVPAPCGYKKHLEIFYGDHVTRPEYYHNLPKILPNHRHKVYWKD